MRAIRPGAANAAGVGRPCGGPDAPLRGDPHPPGGCELVGTASRPRPLLPGSRAGDPLL